MIALKAHYDGKVLVPDEPVTLATNQKVLLQIQPIDGDSAFTPFVDLTAALMNGDDWDETDALHIDPLVAVPADFVRRPGTAAGQIHMTDDFNDTPDDFAEYL